MYSCPTPPPLPSNGTQIDNARYLRECQADETLRRERFIFSIVTHGIEASLILGGFGFILWTLWGMA